MSKVIPIDLTAIDSEAGQHWLSVEQRTAAKRDEIRAKHRDKHQQRNRQNPVINTKPTLKDDENK